jgi:hypothetical protein
VLDNSEHDRGHNMEHAGHIRTSYCVACDAIFGAQVRTHDHCEPVALITVAQFCDLTGTLIARTMASVS